MKNILLTKLFIILLFSTLLSSCISVRRTVYLQDKSLEHPQNAKYDTTFNQPQLVYKIQKGDVIYVDISAYNLTNSEQGAEPLQGYAGSSSSQEVELKGFSVNSDGSIDLPVLGNIAASGLSIEEVRKNIVKLANEYYSNPSVKVFLLNNYITVVGEVRMPGRYHVYKDNMTIIEALALAGDCTDYSEKEKIKVLRNVDGNTHIYFVDVSDLLTSTNNTFYTHPNDVIMVKAQARKKFDTRDFNMALSGVASLVSAINLIFLINKNYIP